MTNPDIEPAEPGNAREPDLHVHANEPTIPKHVEHWLRTLAPAIAAWLKPQLVLLAALPRTLRALELRISQAEASLDHFLYDAEDGSRAAGAVEPERLSDLRERLDALEPEQLTALRQRIEELEGGLSTVMNRSRASRGEPPTAPEPNTGVAATPHAPATTPSTTIPEPARAGRGASSDRAPITPTPTAAPPPAPSAAAAPDAPASRPPSMSDHIPEPSPAGDIRAAASRIPIPSRRIPPKQKSVPLEEADALRDRMLEAMRTGGRDAVRAEQRRIAEECELAPRAVESIFARCQGAFASQYVARRVSIAATRDERAAMIQRYAGLYGKRPEEIEEWCRVQPTATPVIVAS